MIFGDAPENSLPAFSRDLESDLTTFVAKYDTHAAEPADQLFARFVKDITSAYITAWQNKRTLRVTS